jgi:hypothetical protein
MEASCRVDFRPVNADTSCEHTGRIEAIFATGCTIRTQRPESWEALELRIYLPGGDWPLRVDHATVTWVRWDSFSVEFLTLSAPEQERLRNYLAGGDSLVAA